MKSQIAWMMLLVAPAPAMAAEAPAHAGAAGAAQQPFPERRDPAPPPQVTDQQRRLNHLHEALGMLHDANSVAIDLASTAQERATSSSVRAQAADAAREHERLDGEVRRLAERERVDLSIPWPDTPKERGLLDGWRASARSARAVRGAAFDREYLSAMATIGQELARELRIDRDVTDSKPAAALFDDAIATADRHVEIAGHLPRTRGAAAGRRPAAR
jgi:predicted outer membrane protein